MGHHAGRTVRSIKVNPGKDPGRPRITEEERKRRLKVAEEKQLWRDLLSAEQLNMPQLNMATKVDKLHESQASM